MGRMWLPVIGWLGLLATAVPGQQVPPGDHWQITLGEVYNVNSFLCISRHGVDQLIGAREAHHEAPWEPFRFPEECKLAKFAFRPLEITDIERSYYLAQRDGESQMTCTNSQGNVYHCVFIPVTSRYVFGQLLLDRRALDVYVEAPASITVTDP